MLLVKQTRESNSEKEMGLLNSYKFVGRGVPYLDFVRIFRRSIQNQFQMMIYELHVSPEDLLCKYHHHVNLYSTSGARGGEVTLLVHKLWKLCTK